MTTKVVTLDEPARQRIYTCVRLPDVRKRFARKLPTVEGEARIVHSFTVTRGIAVCGTVKAQTSCRIDLTSSGTACHVLWNAGHEEIRRLPCSVCDLNSQMEKKISIFIQPYRTFLLSSQLIGYLVCDATIFIETLVQSLSRSMLISTCYRNVHSTWICSKYCSEEWTIDSNR